MFNFVLHSIAVWTSSRGAGRSIVIVPYRSEDENSSDQAEGKAVKCALKASDLFKIVDRGAASESRIREAAIAKCVRLGRCVAGK
jgi:hypothetical protein